MKNLENQLKEIVQEVLDNHSDLFLVNVKVKKDGDRQKLMVFMDSDQGIDLDWCSIVSKELGYQLEDSNLLRGKYSLEVSSPGLDHPITLHRQYQKNVGREMEIELTNGEKIKGMLSEVNDDNIQLTVEEGSRMFNFKEIVQSKIIISFK